MVNHDVAQFGGIVHATTSLIVNVALFYHVHTCLCLNSEDVHSFYTCILSTSTTYVVIVAEIGVLIKGVFF